MVRRSKWKILLVTSGLSGMKMVNTSFNVRGEPITCSLEDTYRYFMGAELDLLVVGNFVLKKEHQNISLVEDYKEKYVLD